MKFSAGVAVAIAHEKLVREMRNEIEKNHQAVLYEDDDSIVVSGAHTARIKGCVECEKSKP